MTRHDVLRALALGLLAAAVLDPGCATTRAPAVRLVAGADVAPDTVDRLRRALAEAFPTVDAVGDGPATIRIGAGPPAALLAAHRERALRLAVRTRDTAVNVSDVVLPRLVVEGVTSRVRVRVDGPAAMGGTRVSLDVRDQATRQRVGQADGILDARGSAWLEVPLLPGAAGRWPLCVGVRLDDSRERPSCVRTDVDVLPQDVHVETVEGRPSWTMRFARLSLERWERATVHAVARVAPAVVVTTRPAGDAQGAAGTGDADVILVGGLDSLTDDDVTRLTREARDMGRTVLLLADAPLPRGRLRGLWPAAMSEVVAVATPRRIDIGPHVWRAREWLAPVGTSTDVHPVASLDASPPVPVVLARPLGVGRVVLVSALDVWRWRLADDVRFDAGWQALVLSLAADATLARRPAAWRIAGAWRDEVHVARTTQGTTAATASAVAAPLRVDGNEAADAVWLPAGTPGVLRARVSISPSSGPLRLTVPAAGAGPEAPNVIEVGNARAEPAAWDDVQRHLTSDGGEVVDEADLSAALQRLQGGTVSGEVRWFMTRHWWYAGMVIGVLGLEWWWRRLAHHR